ncbi:MAG: hypothetical protein UGF89_12440, partial [Acutalibacteraceae bacterium]|nr:hypothetical protein [Acutalibacteraceae bacterium]
AYSMENMVNGNKTVDVFAVGDIDHNGKAFEEADLSVLTHAIKNPAKLSTEKKYASDINADGKVSEADLIVLNAFYGKSSSEAHTYIGNKCTICGVNK